jgi:hypothetical protein
MPGRATKHAGTLVATTDADDSRRATLSVAWEFGIAEWQAGHGTSSELPAVPVDITWREAVTAPAVMGIITFLFLH